jgi:hypothetical protein
MLRKATRYQVAQCRRDLDSREASSQWILVIPQTLQLHWSLVIDINLVHRVDHELLSTESGTLTTWRGQEMRYLLLDIYLFVVSSFASL